MQLNYKSFPTTQLILIHGLLGSADNWRSLATLWAKAGIQVYTIDQRNHGLSPHSDEHNYTLMAEDLHEFIQKHDIKNPILLGHSMGAKTVMQYVKLYPAEVSKIILADMAPRAYGHKDKHLATFNALLSVGLKNIKTKSEINIPLRIALEKEEEELLKKHPNFHLYIANLTPFLMKGLYKLPDTEEFAWRFNIPALKNHIDDILSPISFDHPIDKPTLLLKGEKSDYVTIEDEKDMRNIFPQLEIITLENTEHWLQADDPEAFYQKVLYFCQKE